VDRRAIDSAKEHVPEAHYRCGDFFAPGPMGLPLADVIVGNPPYVRHERLGAKTKAAIVDTLCADWPGLGRKDLERLVGRGDLAASFLLRLLGQLGPGGVAAIVVSSAIFDSGYGEEFWTLAEEVATLRLIVDAPAERWFQGAAIHAVIAVFDAKASTSQPVTVARLRQPTTEAAAMLREGKALEDVAEMRHAERSAPSTWASILRAPDAWFQFAHSARGALVPLGTLAAVRRGITSGANDIFYLARQQAAEFDIDEAFLQPLLTARGRSGHGAIEVDPDELEDLALVIDADFDLARYPGLQRYLESFSDVEERRTLRNRKPWWSLRTRPAQVFLCKAYGERFVQPYSTQPMVADQRMYCLAPARGVDAELLSALLNATPTALALESLGRASMGQGALEWTVGDLASLPVLDIRNHAAAATLRTSFAALRVRRVHKLAIEATQADRIAMDTALLSPWPDLLGMQADLSSALVATCEARQARAKSGLR